MEQSAVPVMSGRSWPCRRLRVRSSVAFEAALVEVSRSAVELVAVVGVGSQSAAAAGSSEIAAAGAGIDLVAVAVVDIQLPVVECLHLLDSQCTAAELAPGHILAVGLHTAAAGKTAAAAHIAARQVECWVRRRDKNWSRRTLRTSVAVVGELFGDWSEMRSASLARWRFADLGLALPKREGMSKLASPPRNLNHCSRDEQPHSHFATVHVGEWEISKYCRLVCGMLP